MAVAVLDLLVEAPSRKPFTDLTSANNYQTQENQVEERDLESNETAVCIQKHHQTMREPIESSEVNRHLVLERPKLSVSYDLTCIVENFPSVDAAFFKYILIFQRELESLPPFVIYDVSLDFIRGGLKELADLIWGHVVGVEILKFAIVVI